MGGGTNHALTSLNKILFLSPFECPVTKSLLLTTKCIAGIADFVDQNRKLFSKISAILLSLVRPMSCLVILCGLSKIVTLNHKFKWLPLL